MPRGVWCECAGQRPPCEVVRPRLSGTARGWALRATPSSGALASLSAGINAESVRLCSLFFLFLLLCVLSACLSCSFFPFPPSPWLPFSFCFLLAVGLSTLWAFGPTEIGPWVNRAGEHRMVRKSFVQRHRTCKLAKNEKPNQPGPYSDSMCTFQPTYPGWRHVPGSTERYGPGMAAPNSAPRKGCAAGTVTGVKGGPHVGEPTRPPLPLALSCLALLVRRGVRNVFRLSLVDTLPSVCLSSERAFNGVGLNPRP